MSTWADLALLPPETAEEAYRRGYRDGWIRAVDSMHDLMFRQGLSRQDAYDKAFTFFERELLDWVKRDASEMEMPPELTED